jgi:glycosyltransferase involved in cell wall biosynthesis
MGRARVSVVIPNYNHAAFLPRCLDAVLGQEPGPDEVIVLDDASTDDSVAVLERYAAREDRLRLERNPKNLGVVPNMNRGLALATGDVVAFLAADDAVLPQWLARTVPWLEAHPGVGMVSGQTEWRCEATGMSWVQGTRMPGQAGYVSPEDMVRLGRQGRLTYSGQHALIRREALVVVGGWRPELRWFTDWFSTSVVGFRHGLVHIPEVLSVFHTSPTSYYYSADSRAERRAVLGRLLDLLGTAEFTDVAPLIRASGLLGGFGGPILRVLWSDRSRWRWWSVALVRRACRRELEARGRRLLPPRLGQWVLKTFYRGAG